MAYNFKTVLRSTTLIAISTFMLSACATSESGTAVSTSKGTSGQKSSIGQRFDKAFDDAIKEAQSTNDSAESARIYDELISLRPNDAGLATQYARTLRNDNQLVKAQSVIKKFTSGDNADPQALTELAMIYLAQGNFKKAELSARETITKQPENGRAFLALGTALDAQEYHEQAETAFRRGIEYWNGDPAPILNNLALNLASQGKLDEAISILEKAREESPHRMEIERNYRIISTLRETSGPTAPKPNLKPEAPEKPKSMTKPKPLNIKPVQPKPILENDPALKEDDKDVPVIEAEEDIKQEPNTSGAVPSNPRSIQKWKTN